MTDDELERMKEKTQRGTRLEEADDADDFFSDLVEAFAEIEAGDRGKTIALRDQSMAALLGALEDHEDELVSVGQTLQSELGRDIQEEFDKSEICRLALRVGFKEAAPDHLEKLQEAYSEHMKDQF